MARLIIGRLGDSHSRIQVFQRQLRLAQRQDVEQVAGRATCLRPSSPKTLSDAIM